MTTQTDNIKAIIGDYYADKIQTHGRSAKGVDWRDEATQYLRFDQLLRLLDTGADASVMDLGCGYGAFLEYLRKNGHTGHYTGIDFCPDMLKEAEEFSRAFQDYAYVLKHDEQKMADYIVSSGIFNVRQSIPQNEWEKHVFKTLDWKNKFSSKGFAFNCLTAYSDEAYKEERLYYPSPSLLFDYCKENYARNVALLHDYDLYEFTIIVRKDVS